MAKRTQLFIRLVSMRAQNKSEQIGCLLEGFAELDELPIRSNSMTERLSGTFNGNPVTAYDESKTIVMGKCVDARKPSTAETSGPTITRWKC